MLPGWSQLSRGAPTPVAFAWTMVAGSAQDGFEHTGPGRQFAYPCSPCRFKPIDPHWPRDLRVGDGTEIHARTLDYKSMTRTFTEWAANDVQPFREELDRAFQTLTEQLVWQPFLLHEPPVPRERTALSALALPRHHGVRMENPASAQRVPSEQLVNALSDAATVVVSWAHDLSLQDVAALVAFRLEVQWSVCLRGAGQVR